MALINCPECGQNVSSSASTCIHCGFPLVQKNGELIIRGKRHTDPLVKHIYFLYTENGFFDEVLPGEVKRYKVNQSFTLTLGHKRGSLTCAGVQDSIPVYIESNKTTRLECSIGPGLFKRYFLSEVDIIDAD